MEEKFFTVIIMPATGIGIAWFFYWIITQRTRSADYVARQRELEQLSPQIAGWFEQLRLFPRLFAVGFTQFWMSAAITSATGFEGLPAAAVFVATLGLFPLWYGELLRRGVFERFEGTRSEEPR